MLMFKHFMGLGDPSFNLNKHKLQCMEINKNRTRAFSLTGPKCETQSALCERIIYIFIYKYIIYIILYYFNIHIFIWFVSLSVCWKFFPSLSFLLFFFPKFWDKQSIRINKRKDMDISHNNFSASLRQIFLFLSTRRKDQTPVATLHLLLANGVF